MAPNITSIALGSMKLIVEEGRFLLSVSDEPLVRAKDFPVGCFRLLSHTPVHAVGINLNGTLRGEDRNKWDRFGDMLAPKGPWIDFITNKDGERIGGLKTIVMETQKTVGNKKGHMRCSISSDSGGLEATVQMNNHFDIGTQSAPSNGAEAYKLIEEVWDDVIEFSQDMFSRVKELADAA